MAISTIIATAQSRIKDSVSSAPSVGLALRSNGEEKVKVIDSNGNVYDAGFAAPTVAPTLNTTAGGLCGTGYRAYIYVYASSRFPFVGSTRAINGRLWPRSNQSLIAVADFSGANHQLTTSTVTKPNVTGIDTIWIFRTALFGSSTEAQTAAEAGIAFFLTEITGLSGSGTSNFTDNSATDSADQVEVDNYVAPQFQFNTFYDPYFWGFGNMPFQAVATTTNPAAALITLTAGDTWFTGRNGQNITFSNITTGGFDGNGTFKFLWISSTTGTVTLDGVTPVTLPTVAVGVTVTIQGPSTTLYRSKPRNPFSWGFTEVIADVLVPQEYAFNVGGGLGTAIAVVPNNPTLKLDCELPARCFTLNLRSAGTSAFEGTLRIISDIYSVTSHFSQFAAITSNGQAVLWGIDFKNFAILQSNGVSQEPISMPIPKILRALSTDRTKQLLCHGVYDPRTELNCIWVPSLYGLSLIDYLIYQHAPTGFWGFSKEQDVLCSAGIEDTLTGGKKTFIGTQTGLLGQAFVEGVYNNWLPNTGTYTGTITSATSTTITMSTAAFNTVDNGLVGNWCLVTDANGANEQWARISVRTATQLTFDWIKPAIGSITTAFNPVPAAGYKFYIGLIECELLKYFDFNQPQRDKVLMEMWLTQQGADATTTGTLIRFYRETEAAYKQFAPLQVNYQDTTLSDVWFQKTDVPSELVKKFGLKIINRGYQQWKFLNMVLKPKLNP